MSRTLISDDGRVRRYEVRDNGIVTGYDDELIPTTEQVNEQTLRDRAQAALAANTTDQADNAIYLAIASPSAAQVTAQVRALTRQSNTQARELTAVIRLLLGLLDSTDGT
jgi:anti-sigma factor RsiW